MQLEQFLKWMCVDLRKRSIISLRNGLEATVRLLESDDDEKGFFELLGHLAPVPDETTVPHEAFVDCLRETQPYKHVIVVEFGSKIIATLSVSIERKFLRNLSTVGHLEDLVVSPAFRGLGIGQRLLELALAYCFAAKSGGVAACYKVILSCTEENIAFYEKNGFRVHETQMRMDRAEWMG